MHLFFIFLNILIEHAVHLFWLDIFYFLFA